ncbi:MAG: crotonase [Candidatus Dadabacteria bacterium]|nr:MAG: crotonase [Candidatus Dadabacteria bacterium]
MAIQEEDSVLLQIEDKRAKIVINRPKALNALNVDVLQSLLQKLEKVRKEDISVLTFWGAGDKAFVAGADINSMNSFGQGAIADYVGLGQRVMRTIETFPAVCIAAVDGYALGGGLELALACDLIIAKEGAKLGQPEVNLGIIPGFGGTQRLVHRCGIGTAKRLILTGEIITAEEAYRLKVVDYLCSAEEFNSTVTKVTENILEKGPLAVKKAKEIVNCAVERELLSGLTKEVEAFLKLFNTADREEGMNAFLQKRKAEFKGR